MRIFTNILLIILFPDFALLATQTFSGIIGDAGNWIAVVMMALIALIVWIRDEKDFANDYDNQKKYL
jgi:hypothetical protein